MGRKLAFFEVPHRVDAGRLFDDDEVLVEIGQLDAFRVDRLRQSLGEKMNHPPGLHAALVIEAEVAVPLDPPAGDELADLRPWPVDERLERTAQGSGVELVGEMEGLKSRQG